jgi:hypothetical protein
MKRFATVLLLLLSTSRLFGQAEHVPITNPIYDFLDRMQIRGLLPDFSRAAIPLDRGDIVGFLRALDAARSRLSATELSLLGRYADEFVAEADGTQERTMLFAGHESIARRARNLFSEKEKFLYAWASPDRSTTFFMEFLGTAEYRGMIMQNASENVWLGQVGGRFRGTIASNFGYGLQATNGTSLGNLDLARADRVLRQNSNFGDWKNDFFDFTEAYVSARWNWGSASLGKEKTLIGSAAGNKTIVSTNSPAFDAFRLNIHAGNIRFLFLHGFLLADKDTIEDFRPFYEPKYLVVHRLEADLFDALRFGVFETVIYSQRQVDFGYLSPVNFYKSAEHASGDRDNPMLGIDLQTLSIPGSQLYGSWTIDDVTFSKWGNGWWGNKFIWQGGATNHSLIPNGMLGVEYTRIEPYTYTHIFPNNDYTNKGASIGAELAPNSDEWLLQYRQWIGDRVSFALSCQHRRHGANEYDSAGALVHNHGGDFLPRFRAPRDDFKAPFLGGASETQDIVTAGIRYEPLRNYVLDLTYRFRRLSDRTATRSDHFLSLLLDIAY